MGGWMATVRDVVTRTTYKPGWRLRMDRAGGVLIIRWEAVDVDDGGPTLLEQRFEIPAPWRSWGTVSPSEVEAWLKECVTRAEHHERDEWLRVDGRHVTDPHPELRLDRVPAG